MFGYHQDSWSGWGSTEANQSPSNLQANRSKSDLWGNHTSNVVHAQEQVIGVELCDEDLWNQFTSVGTEMVLTKVGRRIFPSFRVRFHGLELNKAYNIMMDIERFDDNRYKFQNGCWTISGKGELPYNQDYFVHPMSSSTGEDIVNSIVSFHKIKLTNSPSKLKKGTFLLHSMHRYRLRVHIVKCSRPQEIYSFSFAKTDFVAVTAYQNARLSQLKIASNPFARGFRPDGARGKEKQSTAQDELSQPKRVCTDRPPNLGHPGSTREEFHHMGCQYHSIRSGHPSPHFEYGHHFTQPPGSVEESQSRNQPYPFLQCERNPLPANAYLQAGGYGATAHSDGKAYHSSQLCLQTGVTKLDFTNLG